MRLEDMKQEFPKTPDFIKQMIEKEVEKQVHGEAEAFTGSEAQSKNSTTYRSNNYRGKRSLHRKARRMAVAVLAATMVLGTTVFAGVRLYQMHLEKVGEYAVKTTIANVGSTETAAGSETENEAYQNHVEVPMVTLDVKYLPAGMVEHEKQKYCFENTMYQGGVSILFYKMDLGDDAFEMQNTNVKSQEELQINGNDATFIELVDADVEQTTFNKRMYVAFTQYHYVMEMYIGSDVSKEEAVKIAEGITLTPTEDATAENLVNDYTWSSYLEGLKAEEAYNASEEADFYNAASADKMQNTHQIGEEFSGEGTGLDDVTGLQIKVSDVQVMDDNSLLNPKYVDEYMTPGFEADGTIKDATVHYIKGGDGVNSVDEEIASRQAAQKLVYVTVEYTNNGTKELKEVMFCGAIAKIREQGDKVLLYNSTEYNENSLKQPKDIMESAEEWDAVTVEGLASTYAEIMGYYDVHGGERHNNYIADIKPGETVTVHMAFVVLEEDLPYLYLNLDTGSDVFEFSEAAFALGYVDIRR